MSIDPEELYSSNNDYFNRPLAKSLLSTLGCRHIVQLSLSYLNYRCSVSSIDLAPDCRQRGLGFEFQPATTQLIGEFVLTGLNTIVSVRCSRHWAVTVTRVTGR